jgi:rhodanese-related sulfurtransferase
MQQILLDIRSQQEWNEGHFSNAIHVLTPLPPITPSQICVLASQLKSLIEKYGPQAHYAVYCKKGKRSGLAEYILKVMGANNVTNLGGIDNEPLASRVTW